MNSLVQNVNNLKNLPDNWVIEDFKLLINDNSGGNKKVKKSDFLEVGKIAIVDQSKDLISGYSDFKEIVVKTPPPYIIFGDHTRVFKYVDFPFIMGADGTKILQPKDEKSFTKYLYYFFLSVNVPDTGYNRHFKYLKDLKIPLPPLVEQQRIAGILDEADKLRQLNKQLITKYEQLSQSLFLEMFGDPVTNPKGWETKTISEFAIVSSGSTPSRKNENNFNGDIPWVKTGEVNGKVIFSTEERITKFALENSSCKLYPKNSIIIAMYGQGKTRGQVGVLGVEATTNQACAVIQIQSDLNYMYLFRLLQLSYENLRNLGRGGNQPNLNSGLIKKYNVSIPPLQLQTQFADRVQLIEQQKQQAQEALQKSENLFNALLQKAFKGGL